MPDANLVRNRGGSEPDLSYLSRSVRCITRVQPAIGSLSSRLILRVVVPACEPEDSLVDVKADDDAVPAKIIAPHLDGTAVLDTNLKNSRSLTSESSEVPLVDFEVMVPFVNQATLVRTEVPFESVRLTHSLLTNGSGRRPYWTRPSFACRRASSSKHQDRSRHP